ncbi:MAG: hypothetical protein ACRD0Z_04135 [Acidimicrobiales bacterium]
MHDQEVEGDQGLVRLSAQTPATGPQRRRGGRRRLVVGLLAAATIAVTAGGYAAAASRGRQPASSPTGRTQLPATGSAKSPTPARLLGGSHGTAASNKVLAAKDAAHLLTLVALPPGAPALSSKAPAGLLAEMRQPAEEPLSPYVVDLARYTVLEMSPASVVAWFTDHAPAGSTKSSGGTSSGPSYEIVDVGYTWPSTVVLDQRDIEVGVTAYGKGSVVRVDAQDLYTPNRPATETAPAGIDRLTITVAGLPGARSYTIANPASIKLFVAALDALDRPDHTVNPGGPCLCHSWDGEKFTAGLYGGKSSIPSTVVTDSPVLAEMGVGNVTFKIGHVTEPVLEDGTWSLAKVVTQLTGVKWVGQPH